uniref:glycosyltransferase family 2 protein n=1 Tax=Pedobacter schmidteae TaxID=2201271 RepID=UPI000EB21CCD|nr:glycosyltransferase family 2 protein [Pedobacter schmidteae]
MKTAKTISPPTKKEQFTLRLMITLGLASMGFFLSSVFEPSIRGYAPLYWMLIAAFVFTCLKTLHEWSHYFYITIPKTPPKTKNYTVDIFTTFCAGEPYEMIKETLVAIQAITYPHQTYLCDEANDPYLKKLCTTLGVNHVTRTEKINAKAGNINNALALSSGELCVVLDPDHVPTPDFLDPIVSHFNDPKIGFVQIVQAYKNNYENLIAKGAAQQTYQFYGPIMMTMNKYGTVLAIGANCTFRRTALESIGGHAAGLAEDMHTAMKLHSKGWKSVYVPRVLARGLVPSTLSAYYKQQLKWSRGVFDLLVTAYPKLFHGFTWQQKIHYAVVPFHYLSGLVYLVNFLIPILSLFLDVSPIRMNIASFGITVLPFIVSTLLIRHFVQWWVMEDEERGFHVVGGLLMIGTWWIFILGLVYTIIGKKVPYVPTPKDGNEANNWPLNIPNLAVVVLSVVAVIYGLNTDWSPYSLMMAGFAILNSLILCFNITASRQQRYRDIREKRPAIDSFLLKIEKIKINFWLMRRRLYAGIRSTALMITLILSCSVLYFAKFASKTEAIASYPDHKSNLFLTGIFSPAGFDGISSVRQAHQHQQDYDTHFNLISVYVPWGNQPQCNLPSKTIDSIYNNGSIPMITWEPWQNLFDEKIHQADKKVFQNITAGKYDSYLQRFSDQVNALKRPVYIRFAHEMDNPFYPWSGTGENTAEEFKAAWKYLYQFFFKRSVYNVVWVWNPWKAENIDAYFPGKTYVDWIGVTNLNYGNLNSSGKSVSMADLYAPFHQNPIFRSGLPVMLAEMGSLSSAGEQDQWLTAAFKARKRFKEIKSFVFFNSAYDKNVPNDPAQNRLNWDIINPENLRNLLKNETPHPDLHKAAPTARLQSISVNYPATPIQKETLFLGIKGINYNSGQDWTRNFQMLTMRNIVADFREMKGLGIHTIKRYGPDIYDRNILKALKAEDMYIHYGFWISDKLDFVADTKELEKLRSKILKSVDLLKNEERIVSWNIGNAVFQKLDLYYYKPELIYQQNAYLSWLKKLLIDIRKIDPKRSISVDVEVSENVIFTVNRLKTTISEIDAYGLVINKKLTGSQLITELKVPYFYSDVTVPAYAALSDRYAGTFIAGWQDEKKINHVRVDGIKDYEGREKPEYTALAHLWKSGPKPDPSPEIKILKPAMATDAGKNLDYHALIKNNNKWELASALPDDFKFEWNLAKVDQFENPVSMNCLATGASFTLTIPQNPSTYRIYLFVIKGNKVVKMIKSELNTPLMVSAN